MPRCAPEGSALGVQRKFTSLHPSRGYYTESGEICLTCHEARSAKDPGTDHRETKVQAHPEGYLRM